MLTNTEVRAMVEHCSYKPGWVILLKGDFEIGEAYLQVSVDETVGRCSVTGKPTSWKGGKKYLSKFMCAQEIVGAVFSVIKAAEEHEMLEWFRYKNASIFNPHLNPDELVKIAKYKRNFVTRPNNQSMTMEETNGN